MINQYKKMKKIKFFLMVLIFIVSSCEKDQLLDPHNQSGDDIANLKSSSPKIRIAVISDIHYLDPSLMPDDYVNDPDFQESMSMDRKLIELSDPIFRKAMSEIIAEKPDILMISGDLSYNGEQSSHSIMTGFLEEIESNGIQVFVVPGNNDILSNEAWDYKTSAPAENITPEQFGEMYENFGYGEAIYTDNNSLSYICEPYPHLWILGINNCQYTLQPDGSYKVTPGINPLTIEWIKENMVEARAKNIAVLAVMHYGIMEHYTGQSNLEKGGLISNREQVARDLMDAGIRLIFTGHFHGNDITDYNYDGKTLTDIETGSLVTPLSPYRIMTLDDNFMKIETHRITEVDAELPGGMNFISYSDSTIKSHLEYLIYFVLRYSYKLSEDNALMLVPFFSKAFMATFAGDEWMGPVERKAIEDLENSAPPEVTAFLPILFSMWTDLPPHSDNKIHIKLK
jgi:3',5'-cyclic AMP phosphodiesterase CpdA